MRIDFSSMPDKNLLIGSLVNRAAELYDSYGDCGNSCNHPSGFCNDSFCNKSSCQNCDAHTIFADEPKDCVGCCLECSEEVHWHKSKRQADPRHGYDCQKLAYYYTCRYSWKYCSEVMYALENRDFSNFGRFKILSLGCGAAPDLMAFEQINRKYKLPIKYLGVDMNPYWEELHSEISNYCLNTDMRVQFRVKDIFDFLENRKRKKLREPYNVVIMQYLISSFPNAERQQKVDTLFDLLIENVISRKDNSEPFLVILNDIDRFDARDYFDTLFFKIKDAGYHDVIVEKAHFKARTSDYGDDSLEYTSLSNKFPTIPSEIINRFNCAVKCSSAQMILEVR